VDAGEGDIAAVRLPEAFVSAVSRGAGGAVDAQAGLGDKDILGMCTVVPQESVPYESVGPLRGSILSTKRFPALAVQGFRISPLRGDQVGPTS